MGCCHHGIQSFHDVGVCHEEGREIGVGSSTDTCLGVGAKRNRSIPDRQLRVAVSGHVLNGEILHDEGPGQDDE